MQGTRRFSQANYGESCRARHSGPRSPKLCLRWAIGSTSFRRVRDSLERWTFDWDSSSFLARDDLLALMGCCSSTWCHRLLEGARKHSMSCMDRLQYGSPPLLSAGSTSPSTQGGNFGNLEPVSYGCGKCLGDIWWYSEKMATWRKHACSLTLGWNGEPTICISIWILNSRIHGVVFSMCWPQGNACRHGHLLPRKVFALQNVSYKSVGNIQSGSRSFSKLFLKIGSNNRVDHYD